MVWNDAVEYIGFFLRQIINESMEKGTFPEQWKLATVTPIPKMKNTIKANEFRPINSMPVNEKIMKTIVKQQLIQHLMGSE